MVITKEGRDVGMIKERIIVRVGGEEGSACYKPARLQQHTRTTAARANVRAGRQARSPNDRAAFSH